MLNWLFDKLEMERKVIKKAPLSFSIACILSLIISGLLWYAGFSTVLAIRTATVQAYKDRFGDLINQKVSTAEGDVFASQIISNFDGVKLHLDYEPEPNSMTFTFITTNHISAFIFPSYEVSRQTSISGKEVIFNKSDACPTNYFIQVDYFRKSLQ